MTTATAISIPDLVDDRYDVLMFGIMDVRQDARFDGNYQQSTSDLYSKLDDALHELMFSLVQHDSEETVDPMVEELHVTIRDLAVAKAAADVASRWSGEHSR